MFSIRSLNRSLVFPTVLCLRRCVLAAVLATRKVHFFLAKILTEIKWFFAYDDCICFRFCSLRSPAAGEEERPDRRRHRLDVRRMAVAGAGQGGHVAGPVHQEQVRRRVDHPKARHHGRPLSTRVSSRTERTFFFQIRLLSCSSTIHKTGEGFFVLRGHRIITFVAGVVAGTTVVGDFSSGKPL